MANGRVRHAYLISGTPAIGKSALAHAFIMALNCTHEDEAARPCGKCRSCGLIQSGNHSDLIYSQTDSKTGALKIDAIRQVMRLVALKPYEARYRTAVFHDFNRALPRAQDALLKTLEEPPPQAVLIVIAESTRGIMPTITSRCQMISLRPVPVDIVRDALMERGADEERAMLLARLSGGRMGWALDALADEAMLEMRDETLNLLEKCLKTNRAGRFEIAGDLGKDKQSLRPLLELWQAYWRDVFLLAQDSPVKPINIDRRVAIEHLAYQIEPEEALVALNATRTLLDHLHKNVNTRLALEVMFLNYPGLER